uniref:Putative secreted protein n=1 Tax=Ixodes ricinus TaxID=34613 RepID=A0A6B0U0D0_IXORI
MKWFSTRRAYWIWVSMTIPPSTRAMNFCCLTKSSVPGLPTTRLVAVPASVALLTQPLTTRATPFRL